MGGWTQVHTVNGNQPMAMVLTHRRLVLFPQVAAHGTGATLPTVDEMIVNMKIVTPAK